MQRRLNRLTLAIAIACAPSLAIAETTDQSPAATSIVDVKLRSEGVLIGQLVTPQGEPKAAELVRLTLPDGRTAEARTNEQGGFAFKGLSGVARLESQHAELVVRAWTAETAPPKATPALLMVDDQQVARGQYYAGNRTQQFFGASKRAFANPLFVAGVVGTAVAIPVAIANNDDDPAS